MSGQISFSMILLSLNGKDCHLCSDNSTKIICMFRPFSFLGFIFHLIIFLIWWVLLAICSKAIWLHFLTGYVFKLFSLFVCFFKHWEISAFSENLLCFPFYFTKVCISIKNALEKFLLIFRVQRNYNICVTKQKTITSFRKHIFPHCTNRF